MESQPFLPRPALVAAELDAAEVGGAHGLLAAGLLVALRGVELADGCHFVPRPSITVIDATTVAHTQENGALALGTGFGWHKAVAVGVKQADREGTIADRAPTKGRIGRMWGEETIGHSAVMTQVRAPKTIGPHQRSQRTFGRFSPDNSLQARGVAKTFWNQSQSPFAGSVQKART